MNLTDADLRAGVTALVLFAIANATWLAIGWNIL